MLNLFRFLLFLAVGFLWITPATAAVPVAEVRLGIHEGTITRFVLELAEKPDFRLFLLKEPNRAVLDLPPLDWPEKLTTASKGLVKGWRHGQFGDGTRVVLDLSGPTSIKNTLVLPPLRPGAGWRLVVDLAAAAEQQIGVTAGKLTKASVATLPPTPPSKKRPSSQLPLIVIDPGHGGVDPGAIAADGTREKDLTLTVSRQLADALKATGKYRVALTRERDRFVPLRNRVQFARSKGADLFISLHADSIKGREARGLSIYTLSDKASDREAAELADSENRADLMAGLEAAGANDDLAAILIDMNQRATMNGSRRLSSLLRSELGRDVKLLTRPERSAGFAVLTAPDVPSVLVEMGYLSSRAEARLLRDKNHQQKIVQGILRGVEGYFRR